MDPLGEEEEEMSCSKVNEKRRGEGGGDVRLFRAFEGGAKAKVKKPLVRDDEEEEEEEFEERLDRERED